MTQQISDTLIYNNEEHYLDDELLEYKIRENPELGPKNQGGLTACWRGYIATYEIVDFELCLKDISLIHTEEENEKDIFLDGLFEDRSKLKLKWLNCLIILYKDKIQGDFNMPELNIYDKYEILEIKNGDLNDSKTFNFKEYEKFKEEQYEYFIISEDYEIAKNRFIENNSKYNEEKFKDQVKNYILWYTKKIY